MQSKKNKAMKPQLSELTTEEIQQILKSLKTGKITDAVIVGFTI